MKKTETVGILGLGVFGRTVAKDLSHYGTTVIAVDRDPLMVKDVADEVTNAAVGDITDFQFLKTLGIHNCDIVVIATGTNLESAVLATMNCKKLGVPQVVAKARSVTFEEVLYEVGADVVVSPERDSGMRLASKILRNKIEEVLRLDDDTSVIEFRAPEKWVGKTVNELDLRKQYELNLIGMRQERGEKLNSSIAINDPIEADTILVAIASSHVFEKFDYLGYFN
ncbi:potassium channel family protein [Vaginisenegalia massiliensis]|uniref:potassium channel family protein n=1 Tax=Vaginisenegalia massiliensis TaxID=2058294 RepID=UPI000F5313AF|nr:TrkA family potassium uptake protein [Vaginisenegalia massiliensis]